MNSKTAALQLVLGLFLAPWLFPNTALADPLDQWTWRNPLPSGRDLVSVTCGNNEFVVVGRGERF